MKITKDFFKDKKFIDFITDETELHGIDKKEIELKDVDIQNYGTFDYHDDYSIVFIEDYNLIFKGDKCIKLIYCYECTFNTIERGLLMLQGHDETVLLWLDDMECKKFSTR